MPVALSATLSDDLPPLHAIAIAAIHFRTVACSVVPGLAPVALQHLVDEVDRYIASENRALAAVKTASSTASSLDVVT